VLGGVFPHAGYMFSGPIAAHSVKKFVERGMPDVLVIIGPNHTGMGSGLALADEDFETPLGVVEYNEDIGNIFIENGIPVDNTAHRYEHSLEVQLPFFQYFEKEFSMVGICMSAQNYRNVERVAGGIRKALKKRSNTMGIVASSDFTHCGSNYGMPIPPGMTAGEYAGQKDKMAIEPILDMDGKALLDTVKRERISMCGYGPVAAMLQGLKKKANRAKLLKYSTSYDIMPGSSAVGYGAIILSE